MPELPDVEVFRQRVERCCKGQTIRNVQVLSTRVLEGVGARQFVAQVEGHRIAGTDRIGKHLLIALQGNGFLSLHFGLTGHPDFVADELPLPAHTRIALRLGHGTLAYVDTRMFGRAGLVQRREELIESKGLGIDALAKELDFPAFRDLARRRGTVKCWLMDQSLIAGIGNDYSDEILFQARLDPHRKAATLSPDELRHLYTVLQRVLEQAIDHGADPKRLSRWLLAHRRAGQPCPGCQGKIARETLCGRSAYYCPECQH